MDAEADRICDAGKYERSEARKDTKASNYVQQLPTAAGNGVTLTVLELCAICCDGDHLRSTARLTSGGMVTDGFQHDKLPV